VYVNGKMRTAETIPGIEGDRVKDNDSVISSLIYFIYCKNFHK
jgi:hypothetical protein